ncbi:hemerythrin domain-containing protein [uncultured Martelella sp.]|uniref:hemerythrin domain-containing protein n=1 Tax=uncultured Martelella sp. TaxID=392331 RepID=UPI0029C89D24|nr:hemerythrin domain-containing protein [uncultured Martelella sp.]
MTVGTLATECLDNPLKQKIPQNPRTASGTLRSTHRSILRLCDALEAVADSLPANVNRNACRRLADDLVPTLKDAQETEEMQVFPQLRHTAAGPQAAGEVLDRLTYEHFEDLCFAEEVTETLKRLSSGDVVNTEAVGYMLRGLFGALRRHIALEQELVANRLQP